MAQPESRPPKGNRPPNGSGPAEPNFNWKGLVLLTIAIALFGAAYVFKGGPMGSVKEVTYPQFVELLEKGEIDKKKGLELINEPSSATDWLKGHLVSPPDALVKAQVNL